MDKIEIQGGIPLQGEVVISGAKNAALPLLASAILVDGRVTFENIPDLMDVASIKLLLEDLGAKIESRDRILDVDASGIDNCEAPYDLVRKMRASILVLGPLLARLGKARVSLPGGCAIGARPVDMHLKGLEALGASISIQHGYIEATAPELVGSEIYFDIPTVTGTENLMMAACLAGGKTVLRNSAREPEIIALARALNQMGADIRGAGTAKIEICGVERLNSACIRVIPDRIEAGTFMVAAAATRGNVLIKGCEPDHMGGIISKLREAGSIVEIEAAGVRVRAGESMTGTDIKTLPYPGFPTDMQAQFILLNSVAEGSAAVTENIFENRFMHVQELQRMGANIELKGHTALVHGVEQLNGAPVMATDLRASAGLVLAGFVATGQTVIDRIYHIDRGYDCIEEKLSQLGGEIQRVSGRKYQQMREAAKAAAEL